MLCLCGVCMCVVRVVSVMCGVCVMYRGYVVCAHVCGMCV